MLLHVIPHNCSEIHRNVAIPDYRSLVNQTSGMDICQIGYDICEFDSLRGLGIDIIGRVHFDNRDRFAIWMGSIGKATEPCQQTSGCWHLTFDSFLNLDMGDDTNTKFLLLRVETTYMTWERENERWLLGDMIDHVGIYGSRVAEGLSAFNVGLVCGVRPMTWYQPISQYRCTMTSSNGNIFRVTGPLWEETTGHQWISLTKASNMEVWCFLWSVPKQAVSEWVI